MRRPRVTAQRDERSHHRTTRRTITYGVTVVLGAAAIVFAVIWLGSRRGECVDAPALVCARSDRGLLIFLPGVLLAAGAAGAFLRASSVWRPSKHIRVHPSLGWVLLAVAVLYLAVSSSILLPNL